MGLSLQQCIFGMFFISARSSLKLWFIYKWWYCTKKKKMFCTFLVIHDAQTTFQCQLCDHKFYLSHFIQYKTVNKEGFSPVWILSWLFKLPLNTWSHFEQVNGFSPFFVGSFIFKSPLLMNALSHFEQPNGFSPMWVLSCTYKAPLSVNELSHIVHTTGFSPV